MFIRKIGVIKGHPSGNDYYLFSAQSNLDPNRKLYLAMDEPDPMYVFQNQYEVELRDKFRDTVDEALCECVGWSKAHGNFRYGIHFSCSDDLLIIDISENDFSVYQYWRNDIVTISQLIPSQCCIVPSPILLKPYASVVTKEKSVYYVYAQTIDCTEVRYTYSVYPEMRLSDFSLKVTRKSVDEVICDILGIHTNYAEHIQYSLDPFGLIKKYRLNETIYEIMARAGFKHALNSKYGLSSTATKKYDDSTRAYLEKCFNKYREKVKEMKARTIRKVIFNDPATIIFWSDGEKTVVKTNKGEKFDPEKGLAMAVAKRYFGNEGNYYNNLRPWLEDYEKAQEVKKDESK